MPSAAQGGAKRKAAPRKPLEPRVVEAARPTLHSGGYDFQRSITASYNVELATTEPLPTELSRDLVMRFLLPNSPRLLVDLNRSSLSMILSVEKAGGGLPLEEEYVFTVVNEPGVNLVRSVQPSP